MAAHGLKNALAARDYLRQALQGASEAQIAPLILSVLIDVGTYLVENNTLEQGAATLAFIQQHPASDEMMKAKAGQLLETQQAVIAPETELDTLITTLLAALATPISRSNGLLTPTRQPDDPTDPSLLDPLSERELEVLRLMAEGLTNRQIAGRLFIVLGTVKAHTSNIYSKLRVSNRTQAVTRAQELKLL
jgi:ATP/maltotriose-dependent transcriptional regulator MalT